MSEDKCVICNELIEGMFGNICPDCWYKEVNTKLHIGHCRHLDICPNCVENLGRKKVKELIFETINNLSKEELMKLNVKGETQ